MKRLIVFILGFVSCLSAHCESEVRAAGILKLGGRDYALFEERNYREKEFTHTYRLVEGAKLWLPGVTNAVVQSIDFQTGRIGVHCGASNQVFSVGAGLDANSDGLILNDAGVDQMIAVYEFIAQTNVLCHPRISTAHFTVTQQFAAKADAIHFLRKALNGHSIDLTRLSPTFEVAVPAGVAVNMDMAKFLKPSEGRRPINAGDIEIYGPSLIQIADIVGQIIFGDSPALLRPLPVSNYPRQFRLEVAASEEEVANAFQCLFLWEGLRLEKKDGGIAVTPR